MKRFSAELLAKDMREICRARNKIYYGGVATVSFLETVDKIRDDYINRTGLRKYILDMLPANVVRLPSAQCVAYKRDGSKITGTNKQEILEFLLVNFDRNDLPYKLDVHRVKTGQEKITLSLSIVRTKKGQAE